VVARAFDELRFGPQRTLNLRENLPSAADATSRAENWLREQQVRGTKEVLVITGRGNQSIGGVGVIRSAVEKLLFSLRRRGVVASHREHNPGAFLVELAPLRALVEAPARRRERNAARAPRASVEGLSAGSLQLLRDLATRSLDALGVRATEDRLGDEMQRHLRAIAPGLTGGEAMESQLRAALMNALADYD
jgi:Smr domain